MLSFNRFPILIEPSIAVIELQRMNDQGTPRDVAAGEPGTWVTFYRQPTGLVLSTFIVPDTVRHVFGDRTEFYSCDVLLCYNAGGVLTHVVHGSTEGRPTVTEVPEELLGQVVERPSVRLVFKDRSERDNFLAELPPQFIQTLVGPPRLVGVGVEA